MTETVWLAIFLVLIGGAMEGSFALPMQRTKRWAWENVWLIYSVVGLIIIPWIAAWMTIPHLSLVYHQVAGQTLFIAALFGFGWGIANVLFGLALPLVGMAITFAVIVGMSAALGSFIPLLLSHRNRLFQPSGLLIMAGVALALVGVVLLGAAGKARERQKSDKSAASTDSSSARATLGLILCVIAGFLAPMLNFSFAFGSAISSRAIQQGAAPSQAANAIWAISLAGGFVSNGGYSIVRLFKDHTWARMTAAGTLSHYALSSLMGVLWTVGLLLYGWGASSLGSLGASVGWPVFQATIVLVSSALGIAAGEWLHVEKRTFRLNIAGLALLIFSIVVLSFGSSM